MCRWKVVLVPIEMFLWRASVRVCQRKVYRKLNAHGSLMHFSLLQISSPQRCLAHQCQTGAFLVSNAFRYRSDSPQWLSHLMAVPARSKSSNYANGIILLCPHFSCVALPVWYASSRAHYTKLQTKNFRITKCICYGWVCCYGLHSNLQWVNIPFKDTF